MRTKLLTYRLYGYDVWGNAKDGWEVNDRFSAGTITVRAKEKVYNQGTPQEFSSFDPSDLQLNRACGIRNAEWDGDEEYMYASDKRNGKPICELELVTN